MKMDSLALIESQAQVPNSIGYAMNEAELEGEWMVSLDERRKVCFLCLLGHTLTMAGRNSYTVQGEGLDKPAQLRKVNEIQHRVLACLREMLTGSASVSFQRSIADWVLNHKDSEMHELMVWAWQSSKTQLP